MYRLSGVSEKVQVPKCKMAERRKVNEKKRSRVPANDAAADHSRAAGAVCCSNVSGQRAAALRLTASSAGLLWLLLTLASLD